MIVQCERCGSFFEVSGEGWERGPRKVRCAFCQARFVVDPASIQAGEGVAAAAAAAAARAPEGATIRLDLRHKPKMPHRELERIYGGAGSATRAVPPTPVREARFTGPLEPGVGFRSQVTTADRKAMMMARAGWLGREATLSVLVPLMDYWEVLTGTPGAVYCQAGRERRGLAVVVEGVVRLVAPAAGEGGEPERLVASLEPGSALGELSLFRGFPSSHWVVAGEEPVTMLLLTDAAFYQLAQEIPHLWQMLVLKLCTRMARGIGARQGGRPPVSLSLLE